jgi:hypothetical protein
MQVSSAALTKSIDGALVRIEGLFLHQCLHGAQTETLPAEYAACGQFIGTDVAAKCATGIATGLLQRCVVLGPAAGASMELATSFQRLVAYWRIVLRHSR